MTDQRFYSGPLKVRLIPPGVFGEDLNKPFAKSRSTWGQIPEGYESTEAAARRLGNTRWGIRKLCLNGRLEHLRKGAGKRCRLFIKQGAKPKPPIRAGKG